MPLLVLRLSLSALLSPPPPLLPARPHPPPAASDGAPDCPSALRALRAAALRLQDALAPSLTNAAALLADGNLDGALL